MIKSLPFTLEYTSISEQNAKSLNSNKQYSGFISSFSGVGNGNPKFLFKNYYRNKPTLLIKTFKDEITLKNVRYLKTLLDMGKFSFRFSPFAYAAPIGYGFFDLSGQNKLQIHGANQIPFAVYVYYDDCKDLYEIIYNDNMEEIITQNKMLDYKRRKNIGNKLFNLYRVLENLKLKFDKCDLFQILHYDIKPENYIIDSSDNIFIVDVDQSGLYNILDKKFIFKPSCDLANYQNHFLPYEVIRGESAKSIIDKERWNIKERYTEIWLAWLLLYRLLTGFEDPFFFYKRTDLKKRFEFIKSNNITDIFSKNAFVLGDLFEHEKEDEKEIYINNLLRHFENALNYSVKKMMNQVFINGFYNFSGRPSFYRFCSDYRISDNLFNL